MTSIGGPALADADPVGDAAGRGRPVGAAGAAEPVDGSSGTGAVGGELSDAELAGRLRLAIGLLVRRLRQRDPGRLSPAQLSALVTVEASGPMRSGDLAARENVAAPTITRLIGAMVDAGLVTRGPDPSDARGALVELAPGGIEALAEIRRARTNQLSRRLGALPPEQRAALVAALPALEALLDE